MERLLKFGIMTEKEKNGRNVQLQVTEGKKTLYFLESKPTAPSQVSLCFTLISVVKFNDTTALEVEGSSPHLICCCMVLYVF